MSKKIEKLEDLKTNPKNHNKGTERGVYAIEQSIRKLGVGRSGVVDAEGRIIAGNHTAEAIAQLGIPIKVIETDGNEWVVVQRTDLNLARDKKAVELSYADNRTAQLNLELELDQLAEDLAKDIDLSYLYTDDEINSILSGMKEDPSSDSDGEDPSAEREPTQHKCPNCGFEFEQ